MATGSQNEKKRRKDFSQRTTDDVEATATTDFRPSVTNDMALPLPFFRHLSHEGQDNTADMFRHYSYGLQQ